VQVNRYFLGSTLNCLGNCLGVNSDVKEKCVN
jgi:hypothetical protein